MTQKDKLNQARIIAKKIKHFDLEYPEEISENALNDFLRYERDKMV